MGSIFKNYKNYPVYKTLLSVNPNLNQLDIINSGACRLTSANVTKECTNIQQLRWSRKKISHFQFIISIQRLKLYFNTITLRGNCNLCRKFCDFRQRQTIKVLTHISNKWLSLVHFEVNGSNRSSLPIIFKFTDLRGTRLNEIKYMSYDNKFFRSLAEIGCFGVGEFDLS